MECSVYSYIASLILLWNQLPPTESSVNLALLKSTSQSSNYSSKYPSSNAVDGLNKQCTNDGFAHTLDGNYEWWQVDLGEMCEIRRIQIYYRTNLLSRLDGYAIDITKSLNPLEIWRCYKDTDNTIPPNPAPSHICQSLGRYVKFSREKAMKDSNGDKAVITLCELEVYGCPQSRYGNGDCNSNCSVGCLNSRCDPDNGYCNCSSGWSGDKCDHIYCNTGSYLQGDRCVPCPLGCVDSNCNVLTGECAKGCKPSFYGTFCNLTCPQNCNNTLCARDSGKCIGCKVGLYGDKCDKICQWNCKDKICKQEDGYCTNCNHPYKGNTCTECVDSKYGDKCTNCSEGCLDAKCDQIHGHCTCKDSFFGYKCNQSCPTNCNNNKCNQTTGDCVDGCKILSVIGKKCNECTDGQYGENCDKECPSSCYLTKCNRIDGSCSVGCTYHNKIGSRCEACVVGLYGKDCDIVCPVNCKHRMCDGTDGTCMFGCKYANMTGNQCDGLTGTKGTDNITNVYIGLIIVGIISSINTVFIAIILILYYKRRRRKETVYENEQVVNSPQTGTNQIENYNLEQLQTVHYETLGLSDRGSINTNSADAYTGLNMIEAGLHENDKS